MAEIFTLRDFGAVEPVGTTARGHGPAPAGFYTCRDRQCEQQRDPFSGRFQKIPNHYHPLAEYDERHKV